MFSSAAHSRAMSRTVTSSRGRSAVPGSPSFSRSKTWWTAAAVSMFETFPEDARQITAYSWTGRQCRAISSAVDSATSLSVPPRIPAARDSSDSPGPPPGGG